MFDSTLKWVRFGVHSILSSVVIFRQTLPCKLTQQKRMLLIQPKIIIAMNRLFIFIIIRYWNAKKKNANAGDRMRRSLKPFSWLIFGLIREIRSIHVHWLDRNCGNGRDHVCVSHQMPGYMCPLLMEDSLRITKFAWKALIRKMFNWIENSMELI